MRQRTPSFSRAVGAVHGAPAAPRRCAGAAASAAAAVARLIAARARFRGPRRERPGLLNLSAFQYIMFPGEFNRSSWLGMEDSVLRTTDLPAATLAPRWSTLLWPLLFPNRTMSQIRKRQSRVKLLFECQQWAAMRPSTAKQSPPVLSAAQSQATTLPPTAGTSSDTGDNELMSLAHRIYLNLHNELIQRECPICFDEVAEEQRLVMPCSENHWTCLSCLQDRLAHMKQTGSAALECHFCRQVADGTILSRTIRERTVPT